MTIVNIYNICLLVVACNKFLGEFLIIATLQKQRMNRVFYKITRCAVCKLLLVLVFAINGVNNNLTGVGLLV